MISENYAQVVKRIDAVAGSAGRDPKDIILVAVTKNSGIKAIFEALDSGIRHIGESKVQEALSKFDLVNDYAVKNNFKVAWHMIGHLQTNKAKEAVKIFDLIHSVDSMRLAEELDKQADSARKIQDVLIEIKTSQEETKYGFLPHEFLATISRLASLKNLNIKGLMTIAPWYDSPEKARPYFKKLKDLSDAIFVHRPSSIVHRPVLSMGMTDDFETAISEGSTMVRIGRAIFGER